MARGKTVYAAHAISADMASSPGIPSGAGVFACSGGDEIYVFTRSGHADTTGWTINVAYAPERADTTASAEDSTLLHWWPDGGGSVAAVVSAILEGRITRFKVPPGMGFAYVYLTGLTGSTKNVDLLVSRTG